MAVISSIADYEWVDFANGSLPTANFNGGILPLANAPYALKAEDKAFLWEAISERQAAFFGATMDGQDLYIGTSMSGGSQSGFWQTPFVRHFDRRLLASDMTVIRNFVGEQLSRGFASIGNGYVDSLSFSETVFETDYEGRDWSGRYDTHFANLRSAHGATWNPSTNANDFVSGAKVAFQPMLNLYSDIRNLEYPVFTFLCTPRATFSLRHGSSPVSSTTNSYLGYQMNSADGDGYWLALPNEPSGESATLMTCPKTFVKTPSLWTIYCASNMVTQNGNTTYKYGFGLVNLNTYFGLYSNNDGWFIPKHAGRCESFINAIVSALGWTLYGYDNADGVVSQELYINRMSSSFLVGEIADGRTKWW